MSVAAKVWGSRISASALASAPIYTTNYRTSPSTKANLPNSIRTTLEELYYEPDVEVHVIDSDFMVNRLQWTQNDVAEIEETSHTLLQELDLLTGVRLARLR